MAFSCSCSKDEGHLRDTWCVGHCPTPSPSFPVTSQPPSAIHQQPFLAEKCPVFSGPEKISAHYYSNSNHCMSQKPIVQTFSHLSATKNCCKALADTQKGSDLPTSFGKNDSYKKNVIHEISTPLLSSIP